LCFASKVFTFATQARGSKQYELTDHLGNIRTVVPDIKEPLSLPQNQNFRLPTLNQIIYNQSKVKETYDKDGKKIPDND
jgi:hypothetical protein